MANYYSIQGGGARITLAPAMLYPYLRTPTAEEYNAHGYYTYANNAPEPPEGQQVASTAYALDEDAKTIRAVYTYEPIPATVRRWTRLAIIRAVKAAGLWSDVRAIITEDQREEFLACDYVLEDDEMAVAVIAAAKAQFGEDKVNALLDAIPTEG